MMTTENYLDFYESLGFEEIEIEDGLTALCFETSSDGNYALLTNEEGDLPENLRQAVIFAYYTSDGSFQWSTSFKNSYLLKELWASSETPEDKLSAIRNRLES